MNQGICQNIFLTLLLVGIGASIGFTQWNHTVEMELWQTVIDKSQLNGEKITDIQIDIATIKGYISSNGQPENP